MREVTGYYDGNMVRLLEPAPRKKQKVIVTFIEEENTLEDLPVGVLAKYADPEKRLLEKGAFECAMVEKVESRTAGTQALKEALGPVGMARFMQQYDSGQGNYTEERKHELDLDMDEIDELLGL